MRLLIALLLGTMLATTGCGATIRPGLSSPAEGNLLNDVDRAGELGRYRLMLWFRWRF